MERFSNGSTSVANTSFNDAGGNNENEPNPEKASKFRKQLPTKNFMSPTISAANKKAAAPKKKILAEMNETLDFVEQTSSSSKGVKFPDHDDLDGKSSSQPYDPIKNYLSPRPKFLRYNPNRRRKMFVLQENEEGVKSSNSFDFSNAIPYSELELGLGASGSKDSRSQKESVEEAEDKIDEGELEDDEEEVFELGLGTSGSKDSRSQKESAEEAEDKIDEGELEDEGEDDEEEVVEFEEDGWWSIKDLLKILFVAIAVILTTRAICSMNHPTPSHTLESMWSFNNWYDNNVYGAAHSNFSGLVQESIREADLMVGRLKEEVVHHGPSKVETIEELVEVQNAQINDVVSKEVENYDTDVILDETLSNQEDTDKLQRIEILQELEIVEIDDIEADIEVHDQPLKEDTEADEKISQLTTDADPEIAKDLENVVEKLEIDDIETNKMLIRFESFNLIVAALIGLLMLVLTSFGVMYHSKQTKSSSPVETIVAKENNVAEKEDIMDLEPSPNPSSLIQQIDEEPFNSAAPQIDVSKEISHIYAPSVELLGELVFGGEVTSSFKKNYFTKDYNISAEVDVSNSLIESTTVSSSQMKPSHKEASTGDSHTTVKKQKRKNTETSSMVTPSSVRRSSRLQNRRSVMSP